jgi:hypothetical protein
MIVAELCDLGHSLAKPVRADKWNHALNHEIKCKCGEDILPHETYSQTLSHREYITMVNAFFRICRL